MINHPGSLSSPPGGSDHGGTYNAATGEDLARLDLGRQQRLGMVEAVWGEHKSAEQILAILQRLQAAGIQGLVTRVSAEKAAAVLAAAESSQPPSPPALSPDAGGNNGDMNNRANHGRNDGINAGHHLPPSAAPLKIDHQPEARLLLCPPVTAASPAPENAEVIVVCAGTSDRAVALEAQLSLACHGIAAALVVDVGVAGLHRLLDRLDQLRSARVLIACAGMEGALPTVLAGLMPQPVIAVPVSVGYGVSAGGTAALHGMLASCAPGLCVVNIDNGYGAAMAALRILGVGRKG